MTTTKRKTRRAPTPRLALSDLALDCLERGTLNGAGHRAWIENDPDLNSLRDNPRFQAILVRI